MCWYVCVGKKIQKSRSGMPERCLPPHMFSHKISVMSSKYLMERPSWQARHAKSVRLNFIYLYWLKGSINQTIFKWRPISFWLTYLQCCRVAGAAPPLLFIWVVGAAPPPSPTVVFFLEKTGKVQLSRSKLRLLRFRVWNNNCILYVLQFFGLV